MLLKVDSKLWSKSGNHIKHIMWK